MDTKRKIKELKKDIKKLKVNNFKTYYNFLDKKICLELKIIFYHYDIENTENNKILNTSNKINSLRNKINNIEEYKLILNGSLTLKPLNKLDNKYILLNELYELKYEKEINNILDYLNYIELNILLDKYKKINNKKKMNNKDILLIERLNILKDITSYK
jgi:hypothetical protein